MVETDYIKENNDQDFLDKIAEAREKVASKLNIDLREPQQHKRIEALKRLYEKYLDEISIQGFIYKEIIRDCDKLISIYSEKKQSLDEMMVLDENFSSTKIRLENMENKYRSVISDLETNIHFNKKLLAAYKSKYVDNEGIESKYRKKLRELSDICWDNWLKALDVNKELQNTIIGLENRKALLEISKLYVDYYIYVDSEIAKCFKKLKQIKRDGISEYYEILSKYDLPIDKKVDFKIFLQKRIESKLSDSSEIKKLFFSFLKMKEDQLSSALNEIRSQHARDSNEITAVVNYYKKFLVNKQVLFTNETEQLVLYFKRRYIEKIDLLCSNFQMFSSDSSAHNRRISESDMNFLKKMIEDEFQSHLNKLKIKHSKRFIPFLDNYWHLEQTIGSEWALDEGVLREKIKQLKLSKNLGLKSLISDFEKDRESIKREFDNKLDLLSEKNKFGISDFDDRLKELRDDCDVLCCELINLNARFWTKVNARFNCEVRRYLIKLRAKYSPYVDSWKGDGKPWMQEYLSTNLKQEFLKAAGEVLIGLTPESDLYLNASKALFSFNEKTRKILADRDSIEISRLMELNTLPNPDVTSLVKISEEKLNELEVCSDKFNNDYNNFYNSLLENEV